MWLDLPFPITGVLADREHIIGWAVSTHHKYDELVTSAATNVPDLAVVRLRNQAQVDHWVRRLPGSVA